MTHPCNHYSCIENYHGECYGEGCKLNPMSAPDADNRDKTENTQEDNQ